MEDKEYMSDDFLQNFLQTLPTEKHALSSPSDRSDLSLLDIFRRVLYPITLEHEAKESSTSVGSLVSLCCDVVTRDEELMKLENASLPINHYYKLMKTAMINNCYHCIAVLMKIWPYSVLSVKDVSPVFWDEWKMLVDDGSKVKYLSKVVKKFILCMMVFLDMVKSGINKSCLYTLDLRGVPMGDKVMNYIVQQLISLSSDVKESDNYHIIIDCAVWTTDTFNQLMLLLKMPKEEEEQKAKINLHINKLDVGFLDPVKSWKILDFVNPNELVGLNIQIDLTDDFNKYYFVNFSKLTALTITRLHYHEDVETENLLPLQFSSQLSRAGLGTRDYYISDILPSETISRLEYFSINDETVASMDANILDIFMTSLPELCELDLTGCIMESSHIFNEILLCLTPSLTVLELEQSMVFQDVDFSFYVAGIVELVNLRYLNLAKNSVRMSVLAEEAEQFGSMPKLECVRFPYITDDLVLSAMDDTPNEVPAETWREEIEKQFALKKSPATQIVWEPYDVGFISTLKDVSITK